MLFYAWKKANNYINKNYIYGIPFTACGVVCWNYAKKTMQQSNYRKNIILVYEQPNDLET